MPPEQVPAEQPMPEQTPPPTGEQLAQEAVNQLYQNAYYQKNSFSNYW